MKNGTEIRPELLPSVSPSMEPSVSVSPSVSMSPEIMNAGTEKLIRLFNAYNDMMDNFTVKTQTEFEDALYSVFEDIREFVVWEDDK